jgi:exodeoxyribonuclease V gamma subunit
VGNDIHDNSIIPPSILVSELLDTIDLGFRDAGHGNRIRDQILTRHPLQPFSRRYFSGTPKLVSYSQELAEASRLAGRGEREPLPFITTPLPEPDEGWYRIELTQLIRFFANPSRYLLHQRLKIDLEEGQEQLETREPFAMDDLAGYALRERMLSLRLAGMSLSDTFAVLCGEGRLPHGRVGECVFEREYEEVERFSARLGKALPRDSLQPLEVDLVLGKRHLTGWLSGVSRQGLVGYRLAKVGPKDYLDLWVRHLVLNVLAPGGVQRISHWLGRDREVMLLPVVDPLFHLQDLLDCYWRGLCWPLPFFPKSALAYVQALAAGKTDPEGAARREWQGNDYHRGECEDHYYQLAFRGSDPLQGEFPQLAQRIFRPLLEHIQA